MSGNGNVATSRAVLRAGATSTDDVTGSRAGLVATPPTSPRDANAAAAADDSPQVPVPTRGRKASTGTGSRAGFHLEGVELATSAYPDKAAGGQSTVLPTPTATTTATASRSTSVAATPRGRVTPRSRSEEPTSLDRHAAALENELDDCADACLDAAEHLQQLPREATSLLRRALRERFPARSAAGKSAAFPSKRRTGDLEFSSEVTEMPVPLFIHDLIESVGQMSHWLLIDEPFDDDEKVLDGSQLDGHTDFVESHEQQCQTAGADALRMVPPHAQKPFSVELLDEYLEQLAEFPTAADLAKSFDHVLTACRIQQAELRGGTRVERYVAERVAQAAEGGPLEGMDDDATVLMVRENERTLAMYSSELVRHLKHWAFALGKYFRLLGRCHDHERKTGHRIHSAGSRAHMQRMSVERKQKAARSEEARHSVRYRGTGYADTVTRANIFAATSAAEGESLVIQRDKSATVHTHRATQAGAGDVAVDEQDGDGQPAEKKRKKKSVPHRASRDIDVADEDNDDEEDEGSESGDSEDQPRRRRKKARKKSGRPSQPLPPSSEDSVTLRAELERLKSQLLNSQELNAQITKERNDAMRQVVILERATGMNTNAAAEDDEEREALGREADEHRSIVARQRAKITQLTEQRDIAIREKLDLRSDKNKLAERVTALEHSLEEVKAQLGAARRLEQDTISPGRANRLGAQNKELVARNEELMYELKKSVEASEDAVFTAQSNAAVAEERIRHLQDVIAERDGTITRLQHQLGEQSLRSAIPAAAASYVAADGEADDDYDRREYSTSPARTKKSVPRSASPSVSRVSTAPERVPTPPRAPSTWDTGWVSRRSTSEEHNERLAERSKAAAIASRQTAEDLRRQPRVQSRLASHNRRPVASDPMDDHQTRDYDGHVAQGAAFHAVQSSHGEQDRDTSSALPHEGDDHDTSGGQPRMFKAALRGSATRRPDPAAVAAADRYYHQPADHHHARQEANRQLFRSPVPEPNPRATEGLDALLFRIRSNPESMASCDISDFADAATEPVLTNLLDALVAFQQGSIRSLDLRNCDRMTDAFAREVVLDTARKLPQLGDIRFEGCGLVTRQTRNDFSDMLRVRMEERAVDQALYDVETNGNMLVSLAARDLTDDAVFRLCDAITEAGPSSALATELRTIDLRDNLLTEDAAMYLLPVISSQKTAVSSVLLDGNTDIPESGLVRVAKAMAKKKLVRRLDAASPQKKTVRPLTTSSVVPANANASLSPASGVNASYASGTTSPQRSYHQQPEYDDDDDAAAAQDREEDAAPVTIPQRPAGAYAHHARQLARLKARPMTQTQTRRVGAGGTSYEGRYAQKPTLVGDL